METRIRKKVVNSEIRVWSVWWVIRGVFVIETLTVIIQISSVVLLKRRVFLMTPIHHHFERLGWHERDIVKLFWIVGFVLSMFALIYGVWL